MRKMEVIARPVEINGENTPRIKAGSFVALRCFPLALVLGTLGVLGTGSAQAATITVTNTNTSGAGSLAQAITTANATGTPDVIEFQVISLGTASIGGTLPAITQPLTIDGYSQLFSSENNRTDKTSNAGIRIELDGSALGGGATILNIQASVTLIQGLAIKNIPSGGRGISVAEGKTNVSILGCFIGTNAAGLVDLSGGTGVHVEGSAIIGTAEVADRNVLIGNLVGIELRGSSSNVDNNLIGLDSDGGDLVGNDVGIRLADGASDNGIGEDQENEISGNSGNGIEAPDSAGEGNLFGHNNIGNNGELGIDLGEPGPDANDEGDADQGPNGLQNHPELNFVRYNADKLKIRGTLHAKPGQHRIFFYKSTNPDPSGFGEGENFSGGTILTIPNGQNSGSFAITFTGTEYPGTEYLAATSMEVATGNTSEFSRWVEVVDAGSEYVVTNTADSGAGSLRQGFSQASEGLEPNTIIFNIPGDGPHTIVAPTELQLNGGGLTLIDGYSQPGASPNKLLDGSDAQLRIELTNGDSETPNSVIQLNNSTAIVQGLAIHSGNGHGIRIIDSSDVQLLGNFIGTDVTGTVDLGNYQNGVRMDSSMRVTIGGAPRAHRNIISGNRLGGIADFSDDTTIVGNLIGFAKDLQPLGNSSRGIYSSGDATVIGGDEPSLQNRIGYTTGPGIEVFGISASVAVRGNSFKGNFELGIDLLPVGSESGVTPNDTDDADQGGNGLLNFPVLTSVEVFPNNFSLEGTLDIDPMSLNPNYTIRVYANSQCDPSGHGEGERFLAAFPLQFFQNDESFLINVQASLAPGELLTATASDIFEKTSEFSACLETPGPDLLCGDASGDDSLSAGDALLALKTAVGTETCELCACDTNSSGSVTSSDALLILQAAVGQSIVLNCPDC